jgi:O-antigen ligase
MLQTIRHLIAPHAETTIRYCVAIYLLSLFTRWGEIPQTAAWIGFLAWLFGAAKPYLAAVARDRLIAVWLALLAWALLGTFWSVHGVPARADWFASFDDHLLVVPLLIHLCLTGRGAQLARVLAWAGVVIVVLNGLQYLGDMRSGAIAAPDNWMKHRKWAYPLVLFSPFLMLQAVQAVAARARLLWSLALLATTLMVLASGARGAWLALAVAAAICGGWLLRGRRRLVLGALAAIALAVPLFLLTPPGEVVRERLAQGFDTSARVSGTWGPSLEMAAQRPWLGHGMGMRAYHDEYMSQVADHPQWFFRDKSMSPHNFFLMALFGLGLPGLALTLALAGLIVARCVGRMRQAATPQEVWLPLALLASFVAHYLVRGSFETLSWPPLALYVGLAAGLTLAARERPAP